MPSIRRLHEATMLLFAKHKERLGFVANTAGALIAVGCTVYVVYSIASEKTLGTLLTPNAMLLAAIFAFIASLLVYAEGWRNLLSNHHAPRLAFTENTLNVSKFHLYKYVPGNVWHYAARQIDLKQRGVPMLKGVSMSIWELGLITLGILIISLAFWISVLVELNATVSFGLCLLLCLMAVLGLKVSGKGTPKLFLWYLGFVAIQLVGVWIIIGSFGENSHPAGFYIQFLSGYTLAWVGGMIIPGAPGGLGVREVIAIQLIDGNALTLPIYEVLLWIRLTGVMSEILFFIVALLLHQFSKRNAHQN